jgi:hypothetical protein
MRSQNRKKSVSANTSLVMMMTPRSRNGNNGGGPRKLTHFKSKLRVGVKGGGGTAMSSMQSPSPSPETAINYFQNDLESQRSPSLENGEKENVLDLSTHPLVSPAPAGNGNCSFEKDSHIV